MRASRMTGVVVASGALLMVGAVAAPKPVVIEPEAEASGEACTLDMIGGTIPEGFDTAQCGEPFDGPPVSNIKGTYQARILVLDGDVVDVVAIEAGTSAAESVGVNTRAIPEFRTRVLEAQSWDVDAVSGASYTSPAFLESLEGAFAAAGL